MTRHGPGAGRTTAGPPLHVVLHGHFYQPPREDPTTDAVLREPSAKPFHDWNQRIHEECYRAVVAARLLDAGGRVRRFVNALEWMSFDAAPTLLRWLEREAPATYHAVLDGDAVARRRTGHGNALATSYHHVILPLAAPADRRTEIRWGLADFQRRFGRKADGFWLPEAAVDMATLEALADEGIAFVVLGSGQVLDLPPRGMPGAVRLTDGRRLAVFVYDGSLSHGVSFGALLDDASAWAEAHLAHRDPSDPALSSLATDGETFGHHHVFGEMALASVIERLRLEPGTDVTNFAAVLAAHPPAHEIRIVAPSSWSCPHGVDRWRRDCGCGSRDGLPGGQSWRTPLRRGLEALGEELATYYQASMAGFVSDPSGTRDRFGQVVEGDEAARVAFVEAEAQRTLDDRERRAMLELLEMQRSALCMFTSCAWFFDALDRVEPRISLRAAGRALTLLPDEALHRRLERRLRQALAEAQDEDGATGADLWRGVFEFVQTPFHRLASTAVLARRAGLEPPTRLGPWDVSLVGDAVALRDRRTTRERRIAAPVETADPRALPYPWDVRIPDALAAAALRDRLGPAELDALLAGRWTLDGARAHALVGALGSLERLSPAEWDTTLDWIREQMDLLVHGPGIPGPVQEALWRAQGRAASRSDALLSRLEALFPVAGLQPPTPS
jgi:hypothetical protein